MGAWSAGSFGNDAALDFADQVATLRELAEPLQAIFAEAGGIEADMASVSIAAADIVAALSGRPGREMPEGLAERLTTFEVPDPDLIALAIAATKRIRVNSELAGLWTDSGDEEWSTATQDLLKRLDMATPYVPSTDQSNAPPAEITSTCYLCAGTVSEADEVTLTAEHDYEDIVSVMTLYAHRKCVVQHFSPPHFNNDESLHENLLKQFSASLAL